MGLEWFCIYLPTSTTSIEQLASVNTSNINMDQIAYLFSQCLRKKRRTGLGQAGAKAFMKWVTGGTSWGVGGVWSTDCTNDDIIAGTCTQVACDQALQRLMSTA